MVEFLLAVLVFGRSGRKIRLGGESRKKPDGPDGKPALHLYVPGLYRGDGLGGGLGIPVVSYAPLPMLVILDESKTAIVMSVWDIVCLWLERGS